MNYMIIVHIVCWRIINW